MAISVTSAKYDDAKTLWDSSTRTFTGNLPRSLYWDISDGLTDSRRQDYLNTGYMAIYFGSTSALTSPLVGTQTLVQYTLANPQLPVLMRGGRGYGLMKGYAASTHPNYQTDGSHIGSGSPFSIDDWAYPTNMRFRDGDTPLGYTLVASEYSGGWSQPDFVPWLLPQLASTATSFGDMQTYMWENYPTYGQDLYNSLVAAGITPTEILLDWEDWTRYWAQGDDYAPLGGPYPSNPGDQQPYYWYERDNRFEQNSLTRYKEDALKDGWGTCIMARLGAVEAKLSSASGEQSDFYDVHHSAMPYIDPTGHPVMYAYGRKKGTFSLYPHYSTNESTLTTLNYILWLHTFTTRLGWEVYDAWTCSAIPTSTYYEAGDLYESLSVTGVSTPLADGEERADDPEGIGQSWEGRYTNYQNIAEAISSTKILFTIGSIKMAHYTSYTNDGTNFAASPSHARWSYLIAADEMQPYHNFIKYGKTYVPPVGVARHHWTTPTSFIEESYRPTICYGKDWNNNAISNYIIIVCRVWEGNMMFCGASFNQTEGTLDLKAPTGQRVTVAYSPYGSITIA